MAREWKIHERRALCSEFALCGVRIWEGYAAKSYAQITCERCKKAYGRNR